MITVQGSPARLSTHFGPPLANFAIAQVVKEAFALKMGGFILFLEV